MVGPSRPITPPPNTITRLEQIFTTTMRRFSKGATLSICLGVASSTAVITCGMPLPLAKGANFTTIHQATIKQTGVMMSNQSA
jgi:hypothetical protein